MKFHEWQQLQTRMATEQLRKMQQEELETGQITITAPDQLLDITGWKSLKLKEGDIIILQPDREINPSATQRIAEQLGRMTKELQVKFMLMPFGWTASVLTKTSEDPKG